MKIKTYQAGPLQANNYLLTDNDEAVLIDCSELTEELSEDLKNFNLRYVLLTHGHFDHVLGINDVRKEFNTDVLIHENDLPRLEENMAIIKTFGGINIEPAKIDGYVKDNEILEFGNTEIKVMHTAGHTEGSVSYLIDGKLFSGDTLFRDYVGRCDLPSGNFNSMKESIRKLFSLDENTEVYAGHGEMTTIGYEKLHNEIVKSL